MSNVDESSYYEIALTNRQVMVAFVILLVSVLGAFFGGVWVGRGQPTSADAEPVAAEGPVELAAVTEGREEPEEFEFFQRNGERPEPVARPDLARIAAEPDPETTLAQDLGVEPKVEPEAAVEPQEAPRKTAPVEPTPQPAESSEEVPTATTDAPAEAEAAGPVVIQVFSSRDETQARRLLTRLQAKGFAAQLSPVQVGRDTMYRVRVGPFDERRQAEAVAARVRRELQVDTWITSAE